MERVQFSWSLLLPGSPRHICQAQMWKIFSSNSMWLSLASSHQPFCWQLLSGPWISNAGRLLMGFWSTYFSASNFFWHTFQFCKWSFALYSCIWFQTPHKPLKAYRSTYSKKKNFTCLKSLLSFALPFFTCTPYFHCASVKALCSPEFMSLPLTCLVRIHEIDEIDSGCLWVPAWDLSMALHLFLHLYRGKPDVPHDY